MQFPAAAWLGHGAIRTNQQKTGVDFLKKKKKKSVFYVHLLGVCLEMNGWSLQAGWRGWGLLLGARLWWPGVSSSFRVALPHRSVQILLLPSPRPLSSSARPAKRPFIERPRTSGALCNAAVFSFRRLLVKVKAVPAGSGCSLPASLAALQNTRKAPGSLELRLGTKKNPGLIGAEAGHHNRFG